MSDLDESIARYQQVLEAIHAAIPTAHQAIRDMREEQKKLRTVREEFVTADDLIKRLDRAVGEGIKAYEESMMAAIRTAQDRVYARFDAIMLIALGEDPESVRQGKQTVTDLLRELIRARNMPVKLTEEIHIEMSPKTKASQQYSHVDKMMKILRPAGIESLPILLDRRVPDDIIWLVLPPVEDTDRTTVYEMNWKTGAGAKEGADAILEHERKLYQAQKARLAAVPAAFKRKDRAGPARSGPTS